MDNGARAINFSGGGVSPSSTAELAVQYANNDSVLIVASSGNDDSSVIWPAAYSTNYSNVIAVGATQYNDQRSFYSNYGAELNVVAPGGAHDDGYPVDPGDIYSTMPNYTVTLNGYPYYVTQNYGYLPGTSMAAPHVSGLAALILSVQPSLGPSQLRALIQETADDKGTPGRDDYYGYGRVNAYIALATFLGPENLVITNAGSIGQSPNLSWDAKPGSDFYNIYRTPGYYYPTNWQVIGTTTNTSYTDAEVIIQDESNADDKYYYRVTAVIQYGETLPSNVVSTWGESFQKRAGRNDIATEEARIPRRFALHQNYPNPFNPETELRYGLPRAGQVKLVIFNLLGKPVRTLVTGKQPAGWYQRLWDGRGDDGEPLPSGVYLYLLTVTPEDGSNPFRAVRKMTLLR